MLTPHLMLLFFSQYYFSPPLILYSMIHLPQLTFVQTSELYIAVLLCW